MADVEDSWDNASERVGRAGGSWDAMTHDEEELDATGRPYREVSYWLEDVPHLRARPRLEGVHEADVAILGGGYTGLWTAYYLTELEPSLRVAILEAEIAGYGASGRNGGWCNSSMLGVSPEELARRVGAEGARAMFMALRETVDEVGQVCQREGIDVAWRKAGVIRAAVGRHELPLLQQRWAAQERLGLTDGCTLLGEVELKRRVRIASARGALHDSHVAFHHPARLVRGLAEVVESRGVTIFEQSPVVDYRLGRSPRLETRDGEVRARTVVFAGEAYMTRLRRWRRRMLPVYSLVVLSEPLTDAQWEQVGWENGECLSSHSLSVDYSSRTHDGRILFGGRGARYRFGSKVAAELDHDPGIHESLRERVRRWFPPLEDVKFTHAWGGPLGVTRDWMPTFEYDPRLGFATVHGYAGQGVAPSNLAGRLMANAITDRVDSPLFELPLASHRARSWEPEPVRWLGVRFVQRGLAAADRRAERSGRPPTGRSLPERLARH